MQISNGRISTDTGNLAVEWNLDLMSSSDGTRENTYLLFAEILYVESSESCETWIYDHATRCILKAYFTKRIEQLYVYIYIYPSNWKQIYNNKFDISVISEKGKFELTF